RGGAKLGRGVFWNPLCFTFAFCPGSNKRVCTPRRNSSFARTNVQQSLLEIMKARFSKRVRLAFAAVMAVWAPSASAQSPPRLGVRFSAGLPTLSITGTVGTVYSIQYASDLSPTNHWTDRTLFQVRGTNDVWPDPSAPTPVRRFYRAVSVPPPA